ncbi:hypothetical protein AF72_07425 [Xylella taiwanensis]|uniref:Uncharacterized protein n=1 Tax=Xylella taiwanensis TaxID=1444770 RepID=Z9JIC1_9GAMM|nr:hypothetical protein AF72_07425 [Xylella taiwanensis]
MYGASDHLNLTTEPCETLQHLCLTDISELSAPHVRQLWLCHAKHVGCFLLSPAAPLDDLADLGGKRACTSISSASGFCRWDVGLGLQVFEVVLQTMGKRIVGSATGWRCGLVC